MFVCLFIYLLTYFASLFEREREREGEREGERARAHDPERGRERGRHRVQSRLHALSCQHRARRRAGTHRARDHHVSRSWTFNRLSHPGAPDVFHCSLKSSQYPYGCCFKFSTRHVTYICLGSISGCDLILLFLWGWIPSSWHFV